MGLRNLPVLPNESGGNDVIEAYIADRKKVQTREELKAFTTKWRALWSLFNGNAKITKEEQSIINGTYDSKKALVCVQTLIAQKSCKHMLDKKRGRRSCVGMHIMLPWPLLHATLMGKNFKVDTDIVLIQANGGYGALHEG